jgi:DNA-binding HxlR family transcriptional regulator
MSKSRTKKELSEEVDLLDSMLSSLIDMLEEKGILTRTEWEKRIKEDIRVE